MRLTRGLIAFEFTVGKRVQRFVLNRLFAKTRMLINCMYFA